jgi:ribosomal-protein-alanine N-acetyltransferase
MDEAHITTIGVLPEYRGQGLGELLLVTLFTDAMRRGAEWVTLEVRVSNESAQALYYKYGFTQQGVRRRYYSDNGEDAYIMWSPPLREPEYVRRFHQLRSALNARMAGIVLPAPQRTSD